MNVDSSSPASRGRGRKLWSGTRPVIAYGMPPLGWRDLYHRALTVSWPVFFLSLAILFLLLNGGFAALYLLGDAAIANQSPAGFGGAFFFSVETLATVGYGDMHPQTVYAHVVSTFEIFIGMSGIAMATGLVFARFSRPQAKILFARLAIVRPPERADDADGACRECAPERDRRSAGEAAADARRGYARGLYAAQDPRPAARAQRASDLPARLEPDARDRRNEPAVRRDGRIARRARRVAADHDRGLRRDDRAGHAGALLMDACGHLLASPLCRPDA
ncbi:hypothetical protein ABID76_000506 [Burkholderia ambifaria]